MNTKIVIFLLCLVSAGCVPVAHKLGYTPTSSYEKAISALQLEHQKAVDDKTREITEAKDGLLAQVRANYQETINSLYGAHIGLELVPDKTRLWQIIDNRVNAAMAFGPPPTVEAILEQNRLLKEELDETKVSAAALAARYNDKLDEAKAAKNKEVTLIAEIEAKREELETVEKNHVAKINNLKDEHAEKLKQALADAQKKNDEQRQKDISKFVWLCGLLTLASIVGSIFSPVYKAEFGWLAVILGAITGAILFLPALYIGVAAGLSIVALCSVAARKYYIKSKTARNSVLAIQSAKLENKEGYMDLLKDKLVDHNTKYVTVNGKIEKVEDTAVTKDIEDILKQHEQI